MVRWQSTPSTELRCDSNIPCLTCRDTCRDGRTGLGGAGLRCGMRTGLSAGPVSQSPGTAVSSAAAVVASAAALHSSACRKQDAQFVCHASANMCQQMRNPAGKSSTACMCTDCCADLGRSATAAGTCLVCMRRVLLLCVANVRQGCLYRRLGVERLQHAPHGR